MTRARSASSLAACLIALLFAACGGTEGAAPTEPTTTGEAPPPATEGEASAGAGDCGAASDCAACVAIDGCNWTGGDCARQCSMDTYCIGPGNPSALECTHDVTILGDWQDDQASAEGDVRIFVRASVELGPSRFRRTMRFDEATEDSGPVFRTNVLAPNEAHTTAEGAWSVEGDRLTVSYRPEGAEEDTVERYDIVDLTPERLRLRTVAP